MEFDVSSSDLTRFFLLRDTVINQRLLRKLISYPDLSRRFGNIQFLLTGLYMSIFHSSIRGRLLKYQEISPLVIS